MNISLNERYDYQIINPINDTINQKLTCCLINLIQRRLDERDGTIYCVLALHMNNKNGALSRLVFNEILLSAYFGSALIRKKNIVYLKGIV